MLRYRTTEVKFGPLLTSGSLMGLGLGGTLEGSIFRQILQGHLFLAEKNMSTNIFWSGVFQLMCLLMIGAGILILWRVLLNPYSPRSTKSFTGSVVMGTGLYFFIEGLINHILLRVHHLMEFDSARATYLWDVLFISAGLALSILGKIMIIRAKRHFYSRAVKKARWKGLSFRPAFKSRGTHLRHT